MGFLAGDTNLRRYVGNSPTLKVDPSGLSPSLDLPLNFTARLGSPGNLKWAMQWEAIERFQFKSGTAVKLKNPRFKDGDGMGEVKAWVDAKATNTQTGKEMPSDGRIVMEFKTTSSEKARQYNWIQFSNRTAVFDDKDSTKADGEVYPVAGPRKLFRKLGEKYIFNDSLDEKIYYPSLRAGQRRLPGEISITPA